NPYSSTPTTNGFYKFHGLCGGDYTVVVDHTQPGLSGFTPTQPDQAPVTLATSATVNNAADFRFTPAPAPTLTCPSGVAANGLLYSSGLAASGGVSPYTFSASGLPAWLSLVPQTGALSGIPTADGPVTFTAKVVDARSTASGTTTRSCYPGKPAA